MAALSAKVSSGDVFLLQDLSIPEQKTRHLAKLLSGLGVAGHVLMVVGDEFEGLNRLARNIPYVMLARVEHLNVYDILRCQNVGYSCRESLKISRSIGREVEPS